MLRAELDDEQQARTERADDGADGVGRVDAADEPAGILPGRGDRASASGKLAPHRIAPGSTTQRQRTISSWKLNHGSCEIDGLIGQYGSDSTACTPPSAIAPHSSI